MMRVSMRFFCCVLLLLTSFAVQAQTFRVSDIRVEGLQRVSAGTVFSALPIRVGDSVSQADIQDATRELFKLGFFADVGMQRDGDVLVLALKERPAINKIEFEGNKAIKTDNLMDSLKKNNLSEGQIFQRATLENIAQALQREYVAQGRYAATVKVDIEDLPRNQVKVKVKVSEGAVARIKQINIVGNKVYKEQQLIDLFELKTSGMWSWLSGNDKYSKEKLKGDLERLESYYLDRGYLSYKTDSSQISLSADKEQIFITVNISEGDVYTVSDVDFAGDPVVDPAILKEFLLVQKGETFSQVLMTTSSEYVTQRLGNEGYTFAKVKGIPEKNEADKTVKVTFSIEPGRRAYVNRINFKGNTKTIDEVLRREMRQMEGGSASKAQIDSSKVRLERLGFFKEVKVETKEVPGSSDKVDVNYTVEESPSGSMNFSVGYAQYSGLLLSAGVQQSNWFGTGKQVGFNLSRSRYQTAYGLSYNDPYFTPDGVSRGARVFYQSSDYAQSLTPYSKDTVGATLTFGYPISEVERINFDIGVEGLKIKDTSTTSQEIKRRLFFNNGIYFDPVYGKGFIENYISQSDAFDALNRAAKGIDYVAGTYKTNALSEDLFSPKGFLDLYGDSFVDYSLGLSWIKSTLNRGILPDRGSQQRLSAQVTIPSSDLEYGKIEYSAQVFTPLVGGFTLRTHGHFGIADKYGKTNRLPFFENYYGGGFGSVRGFRSNSLGPRSSVQETPIPVFAVWDDANGDGIQQQAELSNPALVKCDGSNSSICKLGKVVSVKDTDDYGTYGGAFGGNLIVEGGAEILFPLPFIKDQRSFQTTLFLDAGNVFDTHCGEQQRNCYDLTADQIKASVGLGLTWISSFGPMTFSLSKPVSTENTFDRRESFQFSLGQTF